MSFLSCDNLKSSCEILSEEVCVNLEYLEAEGYERVSGIDVIMYERELSDTIIQLEFSQNHELQRKLVKIITLEDLDSVVNRSSWHVVKSGSKSIVVLDLKRNSLFIVSSTDWSNEIAYIFYPSNSMIKF